MLIEYDHTYNIFLHVKQAESTFLPPTHACRTSPGAFSLLVLGSALFSHRLLETYSPPIHPLHSFFLKLPVYRWTKQILNILLVKRGKRMIIKVRRELTIEWPLIIKPVG